MNTPTTEKVHNTDQNHTNNLEQQSSLSGLEEIEMGAERIGVCLLYTSPSPRD